jgi:hypothetical protein
VDNFWLPLLSIVTSFGCATNSSHPNTGVEIFEPGLGLLIEQKPLADRPISFERSPRIFIFQIGQEAGICTRTVSFTRRDAAGDTTVLMKLRVYC